MAESSDLLKVIEVHGSEYALWDDLVRKSPQGTFFHSIIWADTISRTIDRKYRILLCLRNDHPVGGMLFFTHKKFIWRMITPSPLFPYNAPIFYRSLDEKPQRTIHNQLAVSTKFEEYLHKNYAYWILDAPESSKDMRAFQWQGAIVEPRYSYLVAISNRETLLSNYNQSTRKKLKQGEKQGFAAFESENPEPLINLTKSSYHRHGMRPVLPDLTLGIFLEKALRLQQLKLFYLQIKENIAAGRLVVEDKDTVYDLLAGANDESGIGSTCLVAHILNHYAGDRKYFDFMGADHPQIEQFKRGFGGKLVQGYRVTSRVKMPLSWIIKTYRYRLQQERKI